MKDKRRGKDLRYLPTPISLSIFLSVRVINLFIKGIARGSGKIEKVKRLCVIEPSSTRNEYSWEVYACSNITSIPCAFFHLWTGQDCFIRQPLLAAAADGKTFFVRKKPGQNNAEDQFLRGWTDHTTLVQINQFLTHEEA